METLQACEQGWTDQGTWYLREGPADGPLLLLIHGATVPSWEFERLVPYLWAGGWQTLRFDLLGHGQSARPEIPYTRDAFVDQTEALLQALKVPQPFCILGHSLGAVLGATLASRMPASVQALVLVAPMLNFTSGRLWPRLLQADPWGAWFMRSVVVPLLKRRRQRRYEAIGAPELIERFEEQLARPGFDRALRSMFQQQTLGDQRLVYQEASALSLPKLVVWGEEDHVVSAAQITVLRRLLGAHEFFQGTAMEHNLLLTHTAAVAPVLLDFLAASPLGRRV